MTTLYMVVSPHIYQLICRMCEVDEYQKPDTEGFDGRPVYYNFNNIPYEEIIDTQTGKPIDPTEVNIVHGPYKEDIETQLMTIENYAKRMFCQWVEVAAYNPLERMEHISDEIWKQMSVDPNDGDTPAPLDSRGSVQYRFAEAAAFRMIPCALLTHRSKWYVVYDSGDIDHPDTPEK